MACRPEFRRLRGRIYGRMGWITGSPVADLPNAQIHRLAAGHFAVEDQGKVLSSLQLSFPSTGSDGEYAQ
jgi:hypothetical protein